MNRIEIPAPASRRHTLELATANHHTDLRTKPKRDQPARTARIPATDPPGSRQPQSTPIGPRADPDPRRAPPANHRPTSTTRPEPDTHPRETEHRILEYWSWFAVGIFLLTTVDMITTAYAAHLVGTHAEANPLIRWTLDTGVLAFTLANLLAVVLVTLLFDRVIRAVRTTPTPYDRYATLGIEVWLGGIIALGLFVFANNIAVIIHAQSLIPAS